MKRFSVIVAIPCAPPILIGRELARRECRTMRDVRAWVSRNAATWCDALDPGTSGFTAFVTDDDGEPAFALESARDPDAEPIEHDREDLEEMRAMRRPS